MLRSLVLALGLLALTASAASAQRRPPRPPSRAHLSPEEIAEHDARMAALQARCDEVGRERCLAEDQARRDAHLGEVTRQNVVLVGGVVVLVVGLFAWGRRLERRRSLRNAYAPRTPPPAQAEVEPRDLTLVEVALDARQARLVRRNLDAIIRSHGGRRAALADVAHALAALSWTHVSLRQWPRADATVAEPRHRAVREELAARDSLEVPPDPGRGYRGEPGADEPQLALVSLLVLTRDDVPEQTGAPADAARAALERLARLAPETVIELDVAWYPPGPGETTGARDLLARAPRLSKID